MEALAEQRKSQGRQLELAAAKKRNRPKEQKREVISNELNNADVLFTTGPVRDVLPVLKAFFVPISAN